VDVTPSGDHWLRVGSMETRQTEFTFCCARIKTTPRNLALAIRLIKYLYLVIFNYIYVAK